MAEKIKPQDAPLSSNPFGALAALKASLPNSPAPPNPSSPEPPAKKEPKRFGEKVVVRKEKKGHGGKTVTVVSGVLPAFRADIATALKKSLGTGAREDGDDIVMQGDLVDRVIASLEKEGAKKIIRGS